MSKDLGALTGSVLRGSGGAGLWALLGFLKKCSEHGVSRESRVLLPDFGSFWGDFGIEGFRLHLNPQN